MKDLPLSITGVKDNGRFSYSGGFGRLRNFWRVYCSVDAGKVTDERRYTNHFNGIGVNRIYSDVTWPDNLEIDTQGAVNPRRVA